MGVMVIGALGLIGLLILRSCPAADTHPQEETLSEAGRSRVPAEERPYEPPSAAVAEESATEDAREAGGYCALVGRVTLDGSPASRLLVELEQQEDFRTIAQMSTLTDADGSFAFSRLEAGWYRVSAHEGERIPASRSFRCEADGRRHEAEFDLVHGSRIVRGTVADSEGRFVEKASVAVTQIGGRDVFRSAATVPVDHRGHFVFSVPHEGSYTVWGNAPGYQHGNVDLDENPGPVELRLLRESLVEGVVYTSAGSPAVGATVSMGPNHVALPHTETDEYGRFELIVRPGVRRSTLGARWGDEVGTLAIAELDQGEVRGGVRMDLVPGRTIRGIVHLPNGQPQPVARVLFRVRESAITGFAQADLSGRFEIRGLPQGTVEVWAQGTQIHHQVAVSSDVDEVELILDPR